MKHCHLATLLTLFLPCLTFADWDPEDTTYDPTIAETIANGASRIGDPSPIRQDGYDIVGYTYVQAKPDPNSGVLVWVSFIIPKIPGDTGPLGGAAMFLPMETAETLEGLLVKAIEAAGEKRPGELGKFTEIPDYETWKLLVDDHADSPIVFDHMRGGVPAVYRMSLNPAKKLLDALRHHIAEGKKLAVE